MNTFNLASDSLGAETVHDAVRQAQRAVLEHRWHVEMRRMALASIDLTEYANAGGEIPLGATGYSVDSEAIAR